jgi:two-component system cell cycle sensor histidine kinase/response regulator CckA
VTARDTKPSAIPLEALPDAVLVTDAEGSIVLGNEAAERLFGYAAGDLAGRRLETLVEPVGDAAAARAPLGGSGVRTGRRSDGRGVRLDLRISGMRTGEGNFLIAVAREVPDEWALERTGLAERVERQSRVYGRLAHDFNNLLTVVSSYAVLVRDGAPSSPQARDDLTHIMRAADRGIGLTRELMELAATAPADPAPVVLNDVVVAAEPAIREALDEGVALRMRLEPALPAVCIDPEHAGRIVQDLGRHAARTVSDAEALVIATGTVATNHVELVFTDGGSRRTPATAPEAAGPGRGTDRRADWGALAPAIADALVTRAGGVVEFDRVPGGATAIRVRLPAMTA